MCSQAISLSISSNHHQTTTLEKQMSSDPFAPAVEEISKLPTWQIEEMITDSYCHADKVGDETREGKNAVFLAELLAVELQSRQGMNNDQPPNR